MKPNVYRTLFFSLLRISAFTFGGGFVIIPLIRRQFVEKLGWLSEEDMLDVVAMAQSSPGAVACRRADWPPDCGCSRNALRCFWHGHPAFCMDQPYLAVLRRFPYLACGGRLFAQHAACCCCRHFFCSHFHAQTHPSEKESVLVGAVFWRAGARAFGNQCGMDSFVRRRLWRADLLGGGEASCCLSCS